MSGPALSVAMPVHNAMPYLPEAIRSIREQTIRDFELVILDDRSTDGSTEYLRGAARAEPRIRLIERRRRSTGVDVFGNAVVAATRAPLVARMDADDVALPQRLERQLAAIRDDEDVVMVGTLADGIDSEGRQVRPRDRWRLIRCPLVPFPHGSMMFRRRTFEELGGYRAGTELWEEVDLIMRFGDRGRILVLPESLYRYRFHRGCSSLSFSPAEGGRAAELLRRAIDARRVGRVDPVPPRAAQSPRPSRGAIAAAYRARAALCLWSGAPVPPPRELLAAGGFEWSRDSISVLLRLAWGSFSPRTMRAAARGLVRSRDLLASLLIRDDSPREWALR